MLDVQANVQDVPSLAGVGLKPQHYAEVLENLPPVGWFEVHTENYLGAGGAPHAWLSEIADHYPLSFHGVGLSLASAGGLDPTHLRRVAETIGRYKPGLVSEHLAWSVNGGVYHNDLLPIPYTEEALCIVSDNVKRFQDVIGRRVLIENPSTYFEFETSIIPEPDFLSALAQRAECGILLDINNIHVSAGNHGWNITDYLDTIPGDLVGEIHLAGHARRDVQGQIIRIDDHGSAVSGPVWSSYACTIERIGRRPTLIEWDTDIPDFSVLQGEAAKAARILSIYEDPLLGARHG